MGKYDLVTNLFESTAKYVKACGKRSILETKPMIFERKSFDSLSLCTDTFKSNFPTVLRSFSEEALDEIKPSRFKSILNSRNDIIPDIKSKIDTVDKLALYDEVIPILKNKKLSEKEIIKFFRNVFSDYAKGMNLPDVNAKRQILPSLLKQGYEPGMLSKLPITDFNKKQIEYLLKNADELSQIIHPGIHINEIRNIARFVDDKNIEYLRECLEVTKDPQCLVFWNKDSKNIIKNLCDKNYPISNYSVLLEKINRRGLTYDDVMQIAMEAKISLKDLSLLEFKGFSKLKNVGLNDLNKLTTSEKKNLLNGFITAVTPKYLNIEEIKYLASKMRIFSEMNTSSIESLSSDYYKIIRHLLDSLPNGDRKVILDTTKMYKDLYMTKNTIPAFMDDISKLQYKEEIINGKKLKVVEIPKDSELNIAIHQVGKQEDILNLEAIEITARDTYLCTGLRQCQGFESIDEIKDFISSGQKVKGLHFKKDGIGVAVEPRGQDNIFCLAGSDIWSDGFVKTPYNMVRGTQAHLSDNASSYFVELIKKELDLSSKEYTARIQKVLSARNLDEVQKIDPELAQTIRKVTHEYPMYEGLINSKIKAVCIDAKNQVSEDITNYCSRNDVKLIKIIGFDD